MHVYDEQGNKIQSSSYGANQRLMYKTIYKYDIHSNNIALFEYDADGNLTKEWSYNYEYDQNNNWILITNYKNKKPIAINKREIAYY